MVVTVRSLGLSGISGYEVSVECFLSGGLPAFDVVGLPDAAVRESRERVRAAIKACGAKFPVSRITVNLAPASQRKEGTVYDLPILLGILTAAEELKDLYDQICVVLCQMKDIRGSLRRCRELEQRGTPQPYEQVLRDIVDRDWADSHRDIAPLCKAEDAVELDTGALTFDESLRLLLDTIRRRAGL